MTIKIRNSCEEKILGVMIDHKLKLDPHIRIICENAAQKFGVLKKMSSKEKKKLVFNAIIKSHFSYCRLIWTFSSQRYNNLINQIHEICLRTR